MNELANFWNSMDWAALLTAALRLLAILLCLTVHETCHGVAAFLLGDETARQQQRISLNPLHHIDWLGLIAMMVIGFGWAKPVSVDMRHFRHPKRDMAITALAGPASNFLLALALLALARGLWAWEPDGVFWAGVFRFLLLAAQMSVGLGVFNLIPIPPLDGSKALFALLPDKAYLALMRWERYGFLVLYALIFFGAMDGFLSRSIYAVYSALVNLFF